MVLFWSKLACVIKKHQDRRVPEENLLQMDHATSPTSMHLKNQTRLRLKITIYNIVHEQINSLQVKKAKKRTLRHAGERRSHVTLKLNILEKSV